eukprot:TRINITY_DN33892_c0_g1_i1.p1 TRINITY_DN33892_c0_g1~~TRINITY_DN33892_c0_g1_i1.p1  ORF type:complete len:350 (+),score=104.67 TRINITY_DN33892_c0_g1_i1:74-1051(+)
MAGAVLHHQVARKVCQCRAGAARCRRAAAPRGPLRGARRAAAAAAAAPGVLRDPAPPFPSLAPLLPPPAGVHAFREWVRGEEARALFGAIPLKEALELDFQQAWAEEFETRQAGVLEYWEQLRELRRVLETLSLRGGERVLDVGCGVSTVLHFLPDSVERWGADPLAEVYLRLYEYPPGMSVVPGRGEALPFESNAFDAVFCTNALDHVDHPTLVLSEVSRVLRPGGHFLLSVDLHPAPAPGQQQPPRDPAHPHDIGEGDAERMWTEAGFTELWRATPPFIGLRRWVLGERTHVNRELVVMLRKAEQYPVRGGCAAAALLSDTIR